MKNITLKVNDIMVPLSDYATVSDTATLLGAVRAMVNANKMFGNKPYRHRAVLVLDSSGSVVGKVSQVDIMTALEPNYRQIGDDIHLGRFGFSSSFLKSIREEYKLWERSLEEIYKSLDSIKVTEAMYKPADHQHVNEEDTIDEAMHKIVMGRHQSLLVTKGKKVVGILRSTDVFNAFCDLLLKTEL